MRVRPIVWALFVCSCLCVLLLAATRQTQFPAAMSVSLVSPVPTSAVLTIVDLRLTDQKGIPIEQARVHPSAWMTNMVMVADQVQVKNLGQGIYRVKLHLYMAGPWEIRITASADGFGFVPQTVFLHVQ